MPRFDRLELGPNPEDPGRRPPDEPAGEVVDDQYWLRKAAIERAQCNYESALRLYSRALEVDKTQVGGWVGQVQMLTFLGEYPEAELWARKALDLFKNNAELLAGRAQALCRKGDRSIARAIGDGAMAQPGESPFRWIVRGELMLDDGQDTDRHCFDKALLCSSDPLVPLEIALVCRHYGADHKALGYLRKACEMATDSAAVWYQRACCEAHLGFEDAARRSLERCLGLKPNHDEARALQTKLANRSWSAGRFFRRIFGK